ncbi:MAG: aldose 1-epimerase family protein [Clostridiaceae bacterium]|nr:aldose 1-epimerase family protein [Clostridiaceae bacterium]
MNKTDLYRYAGDASQFYGVRRVTYTDGCARGLAAIEVTSGAGLQFSVLEGRGLDLYEMTYKGVNLSFRTKNGLVSGERFSTVPGEFCRTMNGGMMFTAGFSNVGGDVTEGGVYYPAHGRADGAAASEVYAVTDDEDCSIEIGGKLRESQLFAENLHLTRRIRTNAASPEITIDDTLENLSTRPADIAILYHCNLGYPFLNEGVKIYRSGHEVTPRNEDAAAGLSAYDVMSAPLDNVPEQVFFQKNLPAADGCATVLAVNEQLGLGFYVRYNVDALPHFSQWKSMAAGDYALGLEPSNNLLRGRVDERAAKGLTTIEPFTSVQYHVVLGVLEGANKIDLFRKAYCV